MRERSYRAGSPWLKPRLPSGPLLLAASALLATLVMTSCSMNRSYVFEGVTPALMKFVDEGFSEIELRDWAEEARAEGLLATQAVEIRLAGRKQYLRCAKTYRNETRIHFARIDREGNEDRAHVIAKNSEWALLVEDTCREALHELEEMHAAR